MIYNYSGLDQNSFKEWWDDSDTCMPALMPPVDFLSRMQQRDASSEKYVWVWLYKAPWELDAVTNHDEQLVSLREWHLRQQSVLDVLHHSAGSLLIVDAQITTYRSFKHALTSPQQINNARGELFNSQAHLVAMFKKLAPRYWDTFEALQNASYPSREVIKTNDVIFSEDYFIRLLVNCKNEERLSALLVESRTMRLTLAQMESDVISERRLRFHLENEMQLITKSASANQHELQHELKVLQIQLDDALDELLECHATLDEYSRVLTSSQRTLQRAETAIRDNMS